MLIKEALDFFELSDIPEPQELKEIYRKLAYKYHPDAGGDPRDFIRLQAAYNLLSDHVGGKQSSTDMEIATQLENINIAFNALRTTFERTLRERFRSLDKEIVEKINSYTTGSEIKAKFPRNMRKIWQRFVIEISVYLQKEVESIAEIHDEWLREKMEPALERAKYAYQEHWWERKTNHYIGFGVAMLLFVGGMYWGSPFVIGSGTLLGVLSLLLYYYASQKFAWRRVVSGLQVGNIINRSRLQNIQPPKFMSTDETATTGGIAGAGVGFIFGGPFGAAIGGLLGGAVGALFGKPLHQIKLEVCELVVGSVNEAIPRVLNQIIESLENARDRMLEEVKANYKKNINRVVALITSSASVDNRSKKITFGALLVIRKAYKPYARVKFSTNISKIIFRLNNLGIDSLWFLPEDNLGVPFSGERGIGDSDSLIKFHRKDEICRSQIALRAYSKKSNENVPNDGHKAHLGLVFLKGTMFEWREASGTRITEVPESRWKLDPNSGSQEFIIHIPYFIPWTLIE